MSAELKLGSEGAVFVSGGRVFQSLIVLGKKEWRWGSMVDWGMAKSRGFLGAGWRSVEGTWMMFLWILKRRVTLCWKRCCWSVGQFS